MAQPDPAGGAARKHPLAYVNYLSLLSFLIYGFVMLDANSVTYFSDVLMQELRITAAQYSALSSVVWCTKAVSSVVIGVLADRSGKRKCLVVPLLFLSGLFSLATAAVGSFQMILVMRFLWGFCVGATLSMLVSIVGQNLVRSDFGARSGFISCGSAVIASTAGPALLTWVVLRYTWRGSFLLTGAVILVLAVLMQLTVDEVHCEQLKGNGAGDFFRAVRELFCNRTFLLCLLIGVFECAGKLTLTIFGPLYLTEVMGMSPELKGVCLSVMGLIYIPVSFIIPALADRFDGKRVMLVTFALCLISPLAMVALEGAAASVFALVAFGNWAAATVSIFIYVVPGQTLPPRLIGTANGLIMGVSIFFGGCVCPLILGNIADTPAGIRAIMIACCGMFVLCIILSALIKPAARQNKTGVEANAG